VINQQSLLSGLATVDLLGELIGEDAAQNVFAGSLSALFDESSNQDPRTRRCLVARELIQRWLIEDLRNGMTLTSPQIVIAYLQAHFKGREFESFVVLFLDAQHRLLVAEEMFRGTICQTSVYPREVLKAALLHNSAAVIFAHNHPSGRAEPSQPDVRLTKQLQLALDMIDVRVLDHFVIGSGVTVSFAERGLL
jgi:DNA repair protein RadC